MDSHNETGIYGTIIPYRGKSPTIGDHVFVAPGAVVIGDVHLADGASVWFNSVIRADHEPIHIGLNSNIQDGCVLHIDHGSPVEIGNNVTVGHLAIVHGATIGDGSLIGMNSTILDGSVVGKRCVVGANALVTEGSHFDCETLILGVPARARGKVKRSMLDYMKKNASGYTKLSAEFKKELEA
tara:strand:+ start:1548 stop:2096 length:549 start_codon:yes stop_codon:yes gene_type:complete